ncbi:hypothetical protein ACF07V_31165 [Streptomyces sp. NPDC015661]|uniref:hypothetical protein n=1 Tax=Streptomyces sp. NPDC015661 TaxID=3364961 RepID=UPI0036F8EC18
MFAQAPDEAWEKISCGDGAKGARVHHWAAVRLPTVAEFDYQGEVPHRMRWALARRSIRKPDEIAYYLAYAPLETTVQELVRIAGTRWAIEECFQAAKNECGLDQYEVRRYVGWYRHITLAMLAHAFLATTAHQPREKGVERLSDAVRAWSDIGAPYEVAECRLLLADAQRALGNTRAEALEREAARVAFGRIAGAPTTEVSTAGTPATDVSAADRARSGPEGTTTELTAREQSAAEPNAFVREADYWRVVFDGRRLTVRDSKGMHHLARLLAAPGREFHVLDLVAADSDDPAASGRLVRDTGDVGPLLDDRAKQMYRRRLTEIEGDIEEARADNDFARKEQAELERSFLIDELSRAVGLGGHDRRAGAASERARSAVTQALRKAIGHLRDASPPLGDHLDRTIRTGTYCTYLPDPRLPSPWST